MSNNEIFIILCPTCGEPMHRFKGIDERNFFTYKLNCDGCKIVITSNYPIIEKLPLLKEINT